MREGGHKFALLYFGFTFCPDICPAELIKMKRIIDTLDNSKVGFTGSSQLFRNQCILHHLALDRILALSCCLFSYLWIHIGMVLHKLRTTSRYVSLVLLWSSCKWCLCRISIPEWSVLQGLRSKCLWPAKRSEFIIGMARVDLSCSVADVYIHPVFV